ncbi:MAG: competence/damage-inducible protein A [Cyanobacteriota bacterium]
MIVEIISVGEELLIGQITDTNSAFLAKEVTGLGLNCLYKTTVGDEPEHIKKALGLALERSNIILFTGGLGPTDDDLTLKSVADFFDKEMIFQNNVAKDIEVIFVSRGLEMPQSNLKQAYIPEGSQVVKNFIGTAPGVLWDVSDLVNSKELKMIITFPGVPDEMRHMWKETIRSSIKKYSNKHIYEKYINFIDISESALVEKLNKFMNLDNPKIRPYANNYQIQLRVYSEDKSFDRAKNLVENTIKEIHNIVSEYVYGYNEENLEQVVANLLIKNNKTISLAESCTGGLISSRLTDISGSSNYVKLNLICYSNKAKTEILSVSEESIIKYGAVSSEIAELMARNVRELASCDIGLSVTGIAGPTGGTEEKPVGTVYVAISDSNKTFSTKKIVNPALLRTQIKWRFSQIALNIVRKHLLSL